MNQERSFVKIAFIALVVVALGVAGYFVFINKAPEVTQQTNTPTPTQNGTTTSNQNTGAKITYFGQWTQAQFPQNDYRHSVNIMLPSTWKFNCCGDTNSFSAHSIYPASSENNRETSPRIIVYDFVLSICPDGEYKGCSMDQSQRVTANQYMTSLAKHLDKSGEVVGFQSLKKTGTAKLANFTANAVIYSGVSSSNQPVDLYLIQSPKGVIGVVFQPSQDFDSSFKTEFLNRITSN